MISLPRMFDFIQLCLFSAGCGHFEVVKYLTSIAEDPMFIDNCGNTPLMVAAHGYVPQLHCHTYR